MKAEQSSIDTQLNTAVAQTIVKNKEKLGSIIKTILFCGHQNIALRGNREGNNSNNPGNFRALLDFRVDSGNDVLAQHFSSAPKNAQYTSHRILDEIIDLIGRQIQATILTAIQSGGKLFSIIADECRDCSNKGH